MIKTIVGNLEKYPKVYIDDITIGCDPEFDLINKSRTSILNADHYYDYAADIGEDCGSLELRPKADKDPIKVINCLKRFINKVRQDGFEISIKGNIKSLGGHIHIGLPENKRILI